MSPTFDPNPAATMLAAAWRNEQQLVELPADIRPRSIADGYDIQERLLNTLGVSCVGWKLGLGNPKAMKAAGHTRPVIGRVLERERYASGTTIRIRNRAPVGVEFEIAYVLGRDLPPGSAPVDVLDAVAETRVTFELVQSRFVDRRTVGWPSFVADDSGFKALVVGDPISADTARSLWDNVTVFVGDNAVAKGLAGEDRTDPIGALTALFAHAAERGTTLRRGEIVSTGSVSQPFDRIDPEVRIVARYEGGEISATILRA